MNELIILNNDEQRVSARELHRQLNIEKRFSAWFETNSQGFVEGEDFSRVYLKVQANRYGGEQEIQDYELSIDMAKHICLMSRTPRGKELRQYFIDLEKAWNTPELIMARALQMSQKVIEDKDNQIKEQILRIEEMRPKEIFADAVTASNTSIRVRDMAKILKQNGVNTGEKRLYKWLRDNGYIIKNSTTPTQKAMEMGLFEIIENTVHRADLQPMVTLTTKVTGKGQQYFINKFLGGN